MPIGLAAAASAGPALKALQWIGRGFGNLGRSPLFISTLQGAVAGGRNAAATSLGGNTGNTQRVGKGFTGDGASNQASATYGSGSSNNMLLYIGGAVALLLLMKK